MNSIERLAEGEAEHYIKLLDGSPQELAAAKEDFINGFILGRVKDANERAFVIKQLEQIVDICAQYDEFYSLSIAQYILARLK